MPYAGMAELADALDLGSSGQPCGFDSHYPYQKGRLKKILRTKPQYFQGFRGP